jgi:phosphatidylserine/phosphatidylglycerophosphate/cardiolipin synthase-like enzyme
MKGRVRVAGRAIIVVVVILLLVLVLLPTSVWAQAPRLHEPEQSRPWAVYFSPDDGTRAVAEAIGRAQKSVRVQAAAVTSPPIARALVEAHQRGVSVEVIVNGKVPKGRASAAPSLSQAGIAVLSDRAHAPVGGGAVAVIDRQVVLTGGFSFAAGAESQSAENLLVISDASLAARYSENWQVHAAHSVRPSAQ